MRVCGRPAFVSGAPASERRAFIPTGAVAGVVDRDHVEHRTVRRNPQTVRDGVLRRALTRSKPPAARPAHVHTTAAPRAGNNLRVVSERLRHPTLSITPDTSSDAIPAMQEEAAVLIAGLVSPQVRARMSAGISAFGVREQSEKRRQRPFAGEKLEAAIGVEPMMEVLQS